MKQLQQYLDEYWPKIQQWALELDPLYWGAAGGFFLILIIFRIVAGSRKRRTRKHAPRLSLHAFQVSPLGRDAFLKIRNDGPAATLSELTVKGSTDLLVKNTPAGHRIETSKVYSILMESGNHDKIGSDFIVELTYLDQKGNVYRQDFYPDQQLARQAKLIRYA